MDIVMSESSIINALIGGVLIGIASSILLLYNGRVFGISGILAQTLFPENDLDPGSRRSWRPAVLLGLLSTGFALAIFLPESVDVIATKSYFVYAVAGLLVGFGTQLGSGCTSGHGVCGISRLSRRSILATITFIAAGMVTVALSRLGGEP